MCCELFLACFLLDFIKIVFYIQIDRTHGRFLVVKIATVLAQILNGVLTSIIYSWNIPEHGEMKFLHRNAALFHIVAISNERSLCIFA